ncbi:unnamed protein product [Cuscuta campestris]|uniref:Serine hydrolase domain-containing protein n=1 Tax=Cuscuta campestris TaxID=132261 RepID=A0A484M908_9ASTE|nr:unnamed protein product [Cuscuta campestris]
MSDRKFDHLQYQHQTEGFDESLSYLKTKVSEGGPFDGILGFSQGAAMAALLCAQKEKLKGEIDFRQRSIEKICIMVPELVCKVTVE